MRKTNPNICNENNNNNIQCSSSSVREHEVIQQEVYVDDESFQTKQIIHFTSPLVGLSSTSSSSVVTTTTIPIPTQTTVACDNVDTISFWTGLIVLNTPILHPPSLLFDQLWSMSQYHVCADGGANRLYDSTIVVTEQNSQLQQQQQSQYDNKYIPDLITGDLDSLQPQVREYYESYNVPIIQDYDQDKNDLDKSIRAVIRRYKDEFLSTNGASMLSSTSTTPTTIQQHPDHPKLRIVVYGAFGGRFDQEMASLQALYKWSNVDDHDDRKPRQLILYNDHTMAFLLTGGLNREHRISLALPPPKQTLPETIDTTNSSSSFCSYEGPTCGLIPLGCAVESLTTTGLQWNLNNHPTSFGQLLSTSNCIIDNIVTIQTSHPIVFTAEITTTTTKSLS